MIHDFIIGVDGGTGSLRACLFGPDGTRYGSAVEEYATSRPQNGWAEQKPADWWNALKSAVRRLLDIHGVSKDDVKGMSMATTCCSVVLCGRDGKPVRDAVIWMDVRAFREAEEIAALTGERLSAEWMPCKLLWLKKHEPENFSQAEVFCEYQDWMTFMLTGKWSINVNTACNWGYSNQEKAFPGWFYDKIGLDGAIAKFPDENVYAVGDKIGFLSAGAAVDLGLNPDTVIAQGGIDSSVGLLGMGVCKKGGAALMTGSSNLLMVLSDRLMFSEDSTINAGPDHLIPGLYTAYRGQVSAGSILAWFTKEFCQDLPPEQVFNILNDQAKNIPVGSDGLLVLDYWQGNRHPYYDTKVRGMVYGYSLNHTRAHVYRALMEGIAYGVENLFRQFRVSGLQVKEISLSGGSANSELFLQIYADVSDIRIRIPKDHQSVCLGSAIAAAVACGEYPDLPSAVEAMVRFEKIIDPDEKRHRQYQRLFARYASVYPEFKDWMHKTADTFLSISSL